MESDSVTPWLIVALVLVVSMGVAASFLLVPEFRLAKRRREEARRVPATAPVAEATILKMFTTGRQIGRHPEMLLELEIPRPGMEPIRVEAKSYYRAMHITRLFPGKTVRVRCDLNNPSAAVIVHD